MSLKSLLHYLLYALCFVLRGKNQAAKDIEGRYPISHFWDATEPKLCVCEAKVLAEDIRPPPQPQPWHDELNITNKPSIMEMVINREV